MKDHIPVGSSANQGTQMMIGVVTTLENCLNKAVRVNIQEKNEESSQTLEARSETLSKLPAENSNGWFFYIVSEEFKRKHPKRKDLVCPTDEFGFGGKFIRLSLVDSPVA